jgi:glyoxylase-like metal-dependent hydrolase (beta-lactamase superfamily II)
MDFTTKDRTLDYTDADINIKNVGVINGGDAFLIVTKQKAALFDNGYSFTAQELIQNIRAGLGERALDYILLSHSHYDHASASGFLKREFKGAKIVSSAYAAKILSKPSAINIMRDMNESAARFFGWDCGEAMDAVDVDICVGDGDIIDLGDVTLQALESPGHTKCCITFYMPEKKLLLASETSGCIARPGLVSPAYLVGYEISLNHIRRLMDMEIDKILVPHHGVITGEACGNYLRDALRAMTELKDMILSENKRGKSLEEITERFDKEFNSDRLRLMQPPKAFYLNASYMIPMIIRECE